MNHRGRVNGERLGAAKADRQASQLQPHRQVACRLEAARQLEHHHATETVHLPPGQLVLRVRGQPGVIHAFDLRLLLQEPGESSRVAVVARDAEGQRLHTASQQPGLERMRDHPIDDERLPEGLDALAVTHHQARRHIAVPAEVLRSAVNDQIDAVLERPLIDGSSEGVVHARRDPPLTGEGGDSGEIRDRQRRVGGRLHVNEPRVGSHCFLERGELGLFDERRLDAVTGQPALQRLHRAHVVSLLGDQMIAGLEQAQED